MTKKRASVPTVFGAPTVGTTSIAAQECAHHWRCEPNEGPLSKALCPRCGSEVTLINDYFLLYKIAREALRAEGLSNTMLVH